MNRLGATAHGVSRSIGGITAIGISVLACAAGGWISCSNVSAKPVEISRAIEGNSEELLIDDAPLSVNIDGVDYSLDVEFIRQPGEDRLPVALITHGALSPSDRRALAFKSGGMSSWAYSLARRGYLSVIVLRRGYGRSGGEAAEEAGTCNEPDVDLFFNSQSDDLRAALRAIAFTRPDADLNRVVAIGSSTGGADVLDLASRSDRLEPYRLAAVVNLSGGVVRTEQRLLHLPCTPYANALLSSFAHWGKTVKVPSLWMYAKNDGYFPPERSRKWFQAFTRAGGKADFRMFPAISEDGHFLSANQDGWVYVLPELDSFLRRNRLPTWNVSDIETQMRNVGRAFSKEGEKLIFKFLATVMSNKSLIIADDGMLTESFNFDSIKEASSGALETCQKTKIECQVLIENFRFLPRPAEAVDQ